MAETARKTEMTCGEYLTQQRIALARHRDLGAPGAKEQVVECLSNIYAVSYQMNFERREPPSRTRGPAEMETLDRELVERMSRGLRDKAHVFSDIAADPWRLSEAVTTAQHGNGFPLIEMVNTAFLARTAQREAQHDATGPEDPSRQARTAQTPAPKPAGPTL